MMKWEGAKGTYFARAPLERQEWEKMNNEVENLEYTYTCSGTQNIWQIPRPTT